MEVEQERAGVFRFPAARLRASATIVSLQMNALSLRQGDRRPTDYLRTLPSQPDRAQRWPYPGESSGFH